MVAVFAELSRRNRLYGTPTHATFLSVGERRLTLRNLLLALPLCAAGIAAGSADAATLTYDFDAILLETSSLGSPDAVMTGLFVFDTTTGTFSTADIFIETTLIYDATEILSQGPSGITLQDLAGGPILPIFRTLTATFGEALTPATSSTAFDGSYSNFLFTGTVAGTLTLAPVPLPAAIALLAAALLALVGLRPRSQSDAA